MRYIAGQAGQKAVPWERFGVRFWRRWSVFGGVGVVDMMIP